MRLEESPRTTTNQQACSSPEIHITVGQVLQALGRGLMEAKGINSARSARKRTQVGTTNRPSSLSPKVAAAAAAVASQGHDQERSPTDTGRESPASSVVRSRPASSTDACGPSSSALLPSNPAQNSVSDDTSRGGEYGVGYTKTYEYMVDTLHPSPARVPFRSCSITAVG